MSDVTDSEVAFDAAGPAGAPAVVLVHGSVVTRKMWLPQLEALSDTYRVLAPDLPGHGARAHLPFSFDASVAMLAEFIRIEAAGRALVAGVSLGGYLAIELAAQHPDLVAGLVLTGCTLNFRGVMGLYLKAVAGLMARGWLKQSYAQAEARTRRMFPPELDDVAEAQLAAGVYPEVLGPSFKGMAGKDFAAMLARYPGPRLILNGERDGTVRRGEAQFLAAMQQGRAQAIPNAGHACNLDQPEAYTLAVREFATAIGW